MTSAGEGNYDPKIVQLEIENFWTNIVKEQNKNNIIKTIQSQYPKIYDAYLFRNIKKYKRV